MTSERTARTGPAVHLRAGVAAILAVLLISGSVLVPVPRAMGAEPADYGEPFHFLEPLAPPAGDAADFDETLLDHLVVSICRVEGVACTPVKTLTSASSLSERLRIGFTQGAEAYYLANWDTQKLKLSPDTFRVTVTVEGLTLGSVDVGPAQYKSFGRTWPIKFIVENDPTIRVRILRAAGESASQVAHAIKSEFNLGPEAVAALLAADLDPYSQAEIDLALAGVFQEVVVPETTKVADDATQASLTAFDAATGRMTFTTSTPTLADLEVGDVLVGEPDDAAPNGYLRAVTAITRVKRGPILVDTRQAMINEVITKGTLDAAGDLQPEDIASTEALPGVTLREAQSATATAMFGALDIGDGYSFHEIIDVQLDGATSGSGVSGQGHVRIQGEVSFNAGWNVGFGVEECFTCPPFFTHVDRFEAHAGIDAFVDLKVSGEFDGQLHRETTLSTHYFKPIVFFIGPIPVVLVPIVKAIAGVDGNAHLEFSFEAKVSDKLQLGAKWTDPDDGGEGWKDTSVLPLPSGTADADLEASMELRAYAKADAKLLLYGIAGPGFAGRVGLGAKVQFPGNPLWQVFGHARAEINFAVDLGGVLKLSEHVMDLPEVKFVLKESENGKPVCGARTDPIPAELNERIFLGPREDTNSYRGYFVCQDPEGEKVDYVAREGATEIDYTRALWTVPGTYYVDVTASDQSGMSTTFRLTIEVNNLAPFLSATSPSASVPVSVQYFVAAYAYDKEEGSLLPCSSFTWSATGGTATPTSDTRSCGASVVFAETGSQTVTVKVTDRHGKSSEQPITVNVTSAPGNAAPLIDPNSFKVWADKGPFAVCGPDDLDCDTDYHCIGGFCRVPTGAVLYNGTVGNFHPPLTFSLTASDPDGGSLTVTWHCSAGANTFTVTDNGDGTFSCSPWTSSFAAPIKVWAEVSDGLTTVSSEVRPYLMLDRVG
ncbi:MAG TPA: hypothetical protein VFX65_03475 [Candidatus Limnocylindrales bacterium]|nr:hypothetical protein [Candidatus Limnocylindrales bacterium]